MVTLQQHAAAMLHGARPRQVLTLADSASQDRSLDDRARAQWAALAMQAHVECDQFDAAIAALDQFQVTPSQHPELAYWLGVSQYGLRLSLEEIKGSFDLAADHPLGRLGRAYVHFCMSDFDGALALLNDRINEHWEWDHIRLLMKFQVATSADRLAIAHAALEEADRQLAANPSMLRSLWTDICWVRYLRAEGDYTNAGAMAERLQNRVSQTELPRLRHNVDAALASIAEKSRLGDIDRSLAMNPLTVARDLGLTRKPVLNSLFHHLYKQGQVGSTKEQIVNAIWQERYNPMIHDERVYKAVGRLRRLLAKHQTNTMGIAQCGEAYVMALA